MLQKDFLIPKKIFSKEYENLTGNSKILYAYLCYLENELGKGFEKTIDQMAEDLSVSRKTITRSRNQLSDVGLINYESKNIKFHVFTTYTIKYL